MYHNHCSLSVKLKYSQISHAPPPHSLPPSLPSPTFPPPSQPSSDPLPSRPSPPTLHVLSPQHLLPCSLPLSSSSSQSSLDHRLPSPSLPTGLFHSSHTPLPLSCPFLALPNTSPPPPLACPSFPCLLAHFRPTCRLNALVCLMCRAQLEHIDVETQGKASVGAACRVGLHGMNAKKFHPW